MPIAFVTGGSGFLGRNLVPYLVARGWSVRALARSGTARESVAALGAEAIAGDLAGDGVPASALAGCDAVFHAAAFADDWGEEAVAWEVNVAGTERLLAAARAAGVPRFVHVGTEAVLVGGGPIVDADETRPIPSRPLGIYSRTKAEAERRVIAANAPGFATVVARPRFIWGAGDTTLLPRLVEAAKSGALAWIGGGRYRTSTCHVRNVCEGLLAAAERGRGGEVYFLTDGAPVEFRAMVEDMLRTQDVTPPTREIPRWVAHAFAIATDAAWKVLRLKRRPPITHAAFHLVGEEVTVNDAKARRELGYASTVSREEGLAEMRARVAAV
jgi:nucleoside-diphosphate-sugar epimerase